MNVFDQTEEASSHSFPDVDTRQRRRFANELSYSRYHYQFLMKSGEIILLKYQLS